MNQLKQEKLKRFMLDESMNEAVKEVQLESFTKKVPDNDVHVLAAYRLAINLLKDSWKELDSYKTRQEETKDTPTQVGM